MAHPGFLALDPLEDVFLTSNDLRQELVFVLQILGMFLLHSTLGVPDFFEDVFALGQDFRGQALQEGGVKVVGFGLGFDGCVLATGLHQFHQGSRQRRTHVCECKMF